MTVLGAHEGEGMVLEMEAEVAGSRSPHLASRGQRVDAQIVEVALFFQRELSSAARRSRSTKLQPAFPTAAGPGAASIPGHPDNAGMGPFSGLPDGLLDGLPSGLPNGTSRAEIGVSQNEGDAVLPVMLLSNDNGQIQLARSHGLPAVKIADLRSLDTLPPSQPLSASTLRSTLLPAATKGIPLSSTHSQSDTMSAFRESVWVRACVLACVCVCVCCKGSHLMKYLFICCTRRLCSDVSIGGTSLTCCS